MSACSASVTGSVPGSLRTASIISGHLATVSDRLGTILAPSWGILAHLGDILGPSWDHLGPALAILGHLGASRGFGRGFGGRLEGILGPLGASWELLGDILGGSWGHLGPEGHLGAILGQKGAWGGFGSMSARLFELNFGPILGPKICFFCYLLGSFFGAVFVIFRAAFGAILGIILGADPRKKGPRWAQEGH